MQIIKLDATDSTNQYLKDLVLAGTPIDFTVIVTKEQRKGRGQMGTVWQSETGKNLTFSVLKKISNLDVNNQYQLNVCVSLAIIESLKAISAPDLSIKWPNDIMSGSTKICGILIENVLLGNKIQTSVIGVGLNVNQQNFNNLLNVSSLKLLLGQTFNIDELLNLILSNLKTVFMRWKEEGISGLWNTYESILFRKDKPSTFRNKQDDLFMGFIRGITAEGKLTVELEDAILQEFDLKEIKLLY